MKIEVVKLKASKLEVTNKNAAKGDEFEKILGAVTNNLDLSEGKNIDTESSNANVKLNEDSNDKKEDLIEITDEVININPNVQLLLNHMFNLNDISIKQDNIIQDIEKLTSVEYDKNQPLQEKMISQEHFNLVNIDNEKKLESKTQELSNFSVGDELKGTITNFAELNTNDVKNATTLDDQNDEKNAIILDAQKEIKQIINSVEASKNIEKTITIDEENIDIKMTNANLDIKKAENISDVNLTENNKVEESVVPINDKKEHYVKEFDKKVSDEEETKIEVAELQGNETNIQTKELTVKHLKDEIQKIIPQAKAEEIVNITVEKFKNIRLPDITEVKVKLKPEDLGEITVKVVLEKGEIKGNIIVEKREVALVLQNNIENIKQELRQNNVNLSNISVYLSNDGFNENAGRNLKDFSRGNRQHNINSDFEEENFEEELEGINLYA